MQPAKSWIQMRNLGGGFPRQHSEERARARGVVQAPPTGENGRARFRLWSLLIKTGENKACPPPHPAM